MKPVEWTESWLKQKTRLKKVKIHEEGWVRSPGDELRLARKQ